MQLCDAKKLYGFSGQILWQQGEVHEFWFIVPVVSDSGEITTASYNPAGDEQYIGSRNDGFEKIEDAIAAAKIVISEWNGVLIAGD